MEEPTWVCPSSDHMDAYRHAIDDILSKDPRLIFVVVTNNRADRYTLIKRKTLIGRSVPTQVTFLNFFITFAIKS